MIEYGSDFHYINHLSRSESIWWKTASPFVQLYASGRQALIDLYLFHGWRRLWVPEYYCYEVLTSLKDSGLNLAYYPDYPGADDDALVRSVEFQKGDALLRVNYFGMRRRRSNIGVPVPVVEDHTHDLIGDWAKGSDADYCIASLRKTLPIAEGGALWSPRGYQLPVPPSSKAENEELAKRRWEAMTLKARYLKGKPVKKTTFRSVFLETEPYFNTAPLSLIDAQSKAYLCSFNVALWYGCKRHNIEILSSLKSRYFTLLDAEGDECNLFSFLILCNNSEHRVLLSNYLIENSIYPSVLWKVPICLPVSEAVRSFSSRMLSIHCDGRYSVEDIQHLYSIIDNIVLY